MSPGELLVKAWETTRNVAPAAEVCSVPTTHCGVGRIRWFGPAFTSKYLYFIKGSAAEPCFLIRWHSLRREPLHSVPEGAKGLGSRIPTGATALSWEVEVSRPLHNRTDHERLAPTS